jgi:hypothetical protein
MIPWQHLASCFMHRLQCMPWCHRYNSSPSATTALTLQLLLLLLPQVRFLGFQFAQIKCADKAIAAAKAAIAQSCRQRNSNRCTLK